MVYGDLNKTVTYKPKAVVGIGASSWESALEEVSLSLLVISLFFFKMVGLSCVYILRFNDIF